MKRLSWLLMFVAGLALLFDLSDSQLAFADEQGRIVAVQGRKYKLRHEFHASGGVLPLDAFAKGLSLGGNYTFHFNDFIGLELINFHIVENFNTGLRQDLQDNFGVTTTQFNLIEYILGTSLVIKPIYGKMILFNRTLLHGEISVVAGGGVTKFDDGFKTAANGGFIFRIWLHPAWSIRIDARDYIAFDSGETENILHITLGVSFSFPWS